jgi:hypothetical protein
VQPNTPEKRKVPPKEEPIPKKKSWNRYPEKIEPNNRRNKAIPIEPDNSLICCNEYLKLLLYPKNAK